ncbi:hypothetical protein ACSXC4_12865 [Clostridium perfringens]|uniref:hypothetical protein n=1 Tax=Clostridium perfringens TaxID=1502 RepID=UPI0007761693|nr:hypothetical protein [Clostridium perfringens]AMN33769.1 hypothetical protein JFP55_12990 [Clostridium perfringens]MBI6037066.1 hypothetical protein [Clostridium perfringens]
MDLQVRISIETAEMFEELKNYYEKTMGISFSKSDVLIQAFSYAINKWNQIDWRFVNEKKINIKKYDISQSSLRPKLQVTFDIQEKLLELKEILPKELKLRSVTLGVCIKHILKFALIDIQQNDREIEISDIIEKVKNKYLTDISSEEIKLIIDKFTKDILVELENYEITIK